MGTDLSGGVHVLCCRGNTSEVDGQQHLRETGEMIGTDVWLSAAHRGTT